jgi:uncharacterized protein YukE
MAQMPVLKAHQIQVIISTLQEELAKLDRLGAGIAAVHVNAAIEQLRANLSMLTDDCEWELPVNAGHVPEAQRRIARAFAATTE